MNDYEYIVTGDSHHDMLAEREAKIARYNALLTERYSKSKGTQMAQKATSAYDPRRQEPAPVKGTTVILDYMKTVLGFKAPELIPDFEAKADFSMESYQTPLMTYNGRNATREWYEEAIDGCMYGAQKLMERGNIRDHHFLMMQIEIARYLKAELERQTDGNQATPL